MKKEQTAYRVLEGHGDFTRPDNCWGVQWATDDNGNEYTFSYEADAALFAADYYEEYVRYSLRDWQSYWCYVTDSATIETAMNDGSVKA